MLYLETRGKRYEILDELSIMQSINEVKISDIKIDFSNSNFLDIPYKYQEIKIKKDNDILFTGFVSDVKPSSMKNKKEHRELEISVLSPMLLATVRTSSLIGTYSTKEAISRILEPLINDGFKISNFEIDDGQITTNFILETIENCMNKISKEKNIIWYINERKEIYIYSLDNIFQNYPKMIINENEKLEDKGLYDIIPTIQNIDYANVINFKNVRLIYSQYDMTIDDVVGYPIINSKTIKKGDIVNFLNPLIIDEKTLRNIIKENTEEKKYYNLELQLSNEQINKQYEISIDLFDNMNIRYNKYYISDNISFSDEKIEKEIVLQRDSFFSNLITGFKYNGNETVTINSIRSDTALRYTTMKFVYSQEIEKLKGIISDSGQIEKTIDFNAKWTTLPNLIEYGRSIISQNSNIVNAIELKFDKNPNLEIGDIVKIEMPSFYSAGKYMVKEIDYTYINENDENWRIKLKNSDLFSTYIDLFRKTNSEEPTNKIETLILSEYIEEGIKETHSILIN